MNKAECNRSSLGRRGVSANLYGLVRIGTEKTDKRAIPAQTRDLGKVMLLSSRVISPVPAQLSERSDLSERSENRVSHSLRKNTD